MDKPTRTDARAAIREITPLIRECYELALDDAPDLQGRLDITR